LDHLSDFHRLERREFKYLIPEATAQKLRRAIRPYCVPDAHVADKPSRSYSIESLYFDARDLRLFHENEHASFDRIKLRARTYPEAGSNKVYLEVKRRSGDVVEKTRGVVDEAIALELLDRSRVPSRAAEEAIRRDPGVERFFTLFSIHCAEPVAIVRYDREPYVSMVDDYARITFDRNIVARDAQSIDFLRADQGAGEFRPLDHAEHSWGAGSMVLLELKFTQDVPIWMVDLVQNLELLRGSFSKYGRAVRATRGLPQERAARLGGLWTH